MRKRVFPRILWFLFVYCVVFVLLVSLQFARRGNFSHKIGEMVVSGRYMPGAEGTPLPAAPLPNQAGADNPGGKPEKMLLDGGAGLFFGGLEFRLGSQGDAGLALIDSEGARRHVFAESMTLLENEVVFALPGGMELAFSSLISDRQNGLPEIRISGAFPEGVSAVDIPFRPQRASVAPESAADAPNISYNGILYQFSRELQGLAEGRLILQTGMPVISYRAIPDKKEIHPANFIVQEAETVQAFENALSLWTARNFEIWSRGMSGSTDEDTVIAWCAEAVQQGKYRSAVSAIPVQFSSDPRRTWESAVYQFDRRIGVWERAIRGINAHENEKANRVSRLIEEKNSLLFDEAHLLEFLAIRNNSRMIDEMIAFMGGLEPENLKLEHIPGILEFHLDMARWRSGTDAAAILIEKACQLLLEGLQETADGVFVFSDNQAGMAFNIRLGMALHRWGSLAEKPDWAALGRTLVLSVLSLGDENRTAEAAAPGRKPGAIPVMLPDVSPDSISSAKLYRLIGGNGNLPHAAPTGTSSIWAWTAASSVNITQTDNQIDIYVDFPVGETHYVMLNNIRPFALLRIYDMNWRSAYDFESYYDSSGWYYYGNSRTLVIKLRHRTAREHVRIIISPPRAEPAPPPPAETGENT